MPDTPGLFSLPVPAPLGQTEFVGYAHRSPATASRPSPEKRSPQTVNHVLARSVNYVLTPYTKDRPLRDFLYGTVTVRLNADTTYGFFNGRGMDLDRVLDTPRVTAGERHDERHSGAAHRPDHPSIALAQAVLREPQPAKLVVLIRIGTGQVEHALWFVRHHNRQRPIELVEERRVMRAVGQPDVERAARFPHRIVVLLVQRKSEDAGI